MAHLRDSDIKRTLLRVTAGQITGHYARSWNDDSVLGNLTRLGLTSLIFPTDCTNHGYAHKLTDKGAAWLNGTPKE